MIGYGEMRMSRALFLFLVTFCVLSIFGCSDMVALDPLEGSDSRRGNPNKQRALLLASYRVQKKYDLLEEELQRDYQQYKSSKQSIGCLFATLDLAEFYTYGFINYRKSLELFREAENLNSELKARKYHCDIGEDGEIKYYRASKKYAIPKKYDCEKVSQQVLDAYGRIARIYHHQTIKKPAKFVLPGITPLQTENYAYAIQVDRDLLSISYFEPFANKVAKAAKKYFKSRYKLPQKQHSYYINFNIVRCLSSVFDISSLSKQQTEFVLEYLGNTRSSFVEKENKLQSAYLNYLEVLCMTRLGEYNKALKAFAAFGQQIDETYLELDRLLVQLREAKSDAMVKTTLKSIGFIALHVYTMGQAMASGGGFYLNVGAVGLFDYLGSIPGIDRKITFVGESEYSKNWNILLNLDDQLQLFRAVGKAYHEISDVENSILFNREAINIINQLRSSISTERGRVFFARYRDQTYANLIEDLYADNQTEQAFYFAENSRARALVDLLGSRPELSFGKKELDDFVSKVKEVQIYKDETRRSVGISDQQVEYINKLESELENIGKLSLRGIKLKDGMVEALEKDTSLATKPSGMIRELETLVTVKNLDHNEIRKLLPANSSFLEYYMTNNRVYAWIFDEKEFHSVQLDVDLTILKNHIDGFVTNIENGKPKSYFQTDKGSQYIYSRLFKPVEKYLHNESVYLVAHGFLHTLPFDALYTGQQFLVEKFSFSHLPSGSVLQFLEPFNASTAGVLAIGNPYLSSDHKLPQLPGAEKEAVAVGGYFPKNKVVLNKRATETVFRQESSNFQISHVASHGMFNNEDVLDSKLYLASDGVNDGVLTARELYGLPKVSNTIVLSACETAKAEHKTGDEVFGLIRGFFFAGASSLIASLWAVDDAGTFNLMQNFYHHLVESRMHSRIALKMAKLDLLNSDYYSAPYFWAPFNLYGIGI